MKKLLLFALPALLASLSTAQPAGKRILVFTRAIPTPESSYVHDNIAASVEALRKMGAAHNFAVDASDDATVFSAANLKRYRAIVFTNTKSQAFDTEDQRQAFRDFVQHGGGLVGLHAATTTERQWPYFVSAMGGKFARHPKLQKFVVQVMDAHSPATKGMPATFDWEDEAYFHADLNPDIHILLATDPAKLDDPERGKFPGSLRNGLLPLAWTINTNGVRVFYTALGHQKEHYADPLLANHILGGLLWAMGEK